MFDVRSKRLRFTLAALSLASAIFVGTSSLAQPQLEPRIATPAVDSEDQSEAKKVETTTTVTTTTTTAVQPEKLAEPASRFKRFVTPEEQAATDIAQTQALDHFDLSRFYFSQFDFKMCEVELEAAIMYMPLMKVAHRDLCIVSVLTGHPLRSIAEFMMVMGMGEPVPLTEVEKTELKLRGSKMHYKKALEYGKRDKWDNAISELKWALDFTPTNAAIKRSLAFALASKGEFNMAEEQYKDSIAEDPADPYTHADFAYLLSEKGEPNRAFSQLAEAVKLAPNATALHVDLAWMAESKGDFSTASTELEQAIKLSPTHAGLWAHLGRVDERKGDFDSAVAAYNRALNVDPGQEEARRRLKVIKSEGLKTKNGNKDASVEVSPAQPGGQSPQKPELERLPDGSPAPVKGT
ncbi:MAG: tetratricopeptide repeat protein [Leptolyngbya sp.]|nr:tetratricopeptide repeat protein [Candidatus Melainabacteria bacterium]